ncbi:Dihydrolipoyllysine-residue acetyltransferase [Candidatus Hepatincolaceae symbiont of Richtersius coronifer]
MAISANNKSDKIYITPLANRMMKESKLDISSIKGTGPRGRIIKQDIELALKAGLSVQATAQAPITIAAEAFEDRPTTGMRQTIAKRLLESKVTIPHYYLATDCNMDNLLSVREQINKKNSDKFKLSINDFIIKAVAVALKKIPDVNASWMGSFIRHYKTCDIAIAVATPKGLFTPIIKNAETKGLVEISNEMKILAKKANEGKLKPEEYQGGGFSISNLGSSGIKDFYPIINPPHAAILGVGTTEQRAIVKEGQLEIGNIISLTLSADHRVLDGLMAARFLEELKQTLENPMNMLL